MGRIAAAIAVACVAVMAAACVPPPTYIPGPNPQVPALLLSCDAFGESRYNVEPNGWQGIGSPASPCTGALIDSYGPVVGVDFNFVGDPFATCDDNTPVPLHGLVEITFDMTDAATGNPHQVIAGVTAQPRPMP